MTLYVGNSRETVVDSKGYETLHQELLDSTGFLLVEWSAGREMEAELMAKGSGRHSSRVSSVL